MDYNDKFCVSCGFNLEKLLCPSCGGAVNDGDAFCSNCGAKLINELKCSSCGSKVEKGDKFCSVCGNKLN